MRRRKFMVLIGSALLTSLETAAAIEVSTSRRIVLRNCAALEAG
jgi:hypothetical protein